MSADRKILGVWTVVESDHLEKPVWIRMGTAFVNRDASINVFLDAIPMNGRLHIRELEPKKGATQCEPQPK